ncbi:MAG TPA: hypothetical protein VF631_05230 [Allosphingosinicella sp.]|jgi:hypothetical protein|uniref:hypothetical protein n=1 Tax=Allosphingosinicella sp. TaxID=2823234 RepID=UPI002F28290C
MTTNINPIRPKLKVPKHNPARDDLAILFARLAADCKVKAEELAHTEDGSARHQAALALAGIDRKLPRNNLRLLLSTLDEERDFLLRCSELEVLKAEHALESKRIGRLSILEGGSAWWDSPTIKPLVHDNNDKWELYRARLLELAHTPARTRQHLDRKRSLIGKGWLNAAGPWYDQLRAGVTADEAWLAANVPTRQRRRA